MVVVELVTLGVVMLGVVYVILVAVVKSPDVAINLFAVKSPNKLPTAPLFAVTRALAGNLPVSNVLVQVFTLFQIPKSARV